MGTKWWRVLISQLSQYDWIDQLTLCKEISGKNDDRRQTPGQRQLRNWEKPKRRQRRGWENLKRQPRRGWGKLRSVYRWKDHKSPIFENSWIFFPDVAFCRGCYDNSCFQLNIEYGCLCSKFSDWIVNGECELTKDVAGERYFGSVTRVQGEKGGHCHQRKCRL